MTKWTRTPHGLRRLNLGHGLELQVWYESLTRLPAGAPGYNICVFGQRLTTRSAEIPEAKRRAEQAARRWLQEALLKLNGRI